MQDLSYSVVPTAPPILSADGADWILIIHPAEPGEPVAAVRTSAFSVYTGAELFGHQALDLHALRWRPPRAVVIELAERSSEASAFARFLIESWIGGGVPTVLAAPLDVVTGVDDLPVDDFVVAPYSRTEIAARIRRIERRRPAPAGSSRLEIGALAIDTAAHHVEASGRTVALTRLEYALLVFLVQNPGRVYTRDELLARVWGTGANAGGRTVDIHIRRLRAKLGAAVSALVTVRGVGYRFDDAGDGRRADSLG